MRRVEDRSVCILLQFFVVEIANYIINTVFWHYSSLLYIYSESGSGVQERLTL